MFLGILTSSSLICILCFILIVCYSSNQFEKNRAEVSLMR